MESHKTIKQKVLDSQLEIKKKINSIEFDTHWFRRVFHTFAASFLIYYMLPDEEWINILKICIPVGIIIFVFTLKSYRATLCCTIHISKF